MQTNVQSYTRARVAPPPSLMRARACENTRNVIESLYTLSLQSPHECSARRALRVRSTSMENSNALNTNCKYCSRRCTRAPLRSGAPWTLRATPAARRTGTASSEDGSKSQRARRGRMRVRRMRAGAGRSAPL